MRTLLLLAILAAPFFTEKTAAQTKKAAAKISKKDLAELAGISDSLAALGETMLHDPVGDNRFAACHAILPMLSRAVSVENSFRFKFPTVKTISIQYPADSTFRVFTWQLFVDDSTYRYFGAIQMNDPKPRLSRSTTTAT